MSGGGPPPASEEAARFVHFGDDLGGDGMLLSMLMIPQQPLIIEHPSDGQPEQTRALIARCAAALDYEIIEQGNVEGTGQPELPRSAPGCAAAA